VIDDRDLEDRVRRTLGYVAAIPLGELGAVPQSIPTGRAAKSHALWPRVAIVLTSIAVVIAAVVVSLEARRASPPAPAVPVPADVTGVPQILKVEATVPLSGSFGFSPAQVVAGSEHTFGLGSLQFSTVYENLTSDVPAHSGYQANLNITTPGVGGSEGVPFTPSRHPLPGVWNVQDEPRKGDQLVVWIGLPAGTAFVTYTYRGSTYWERPQWGVAAFVAPQQGAGLGRTNESLTSLERRHALPEMVAYDATGRLLMRYFVYTTGGVNVYSNQ
jgi:hypothetical protein